ncbi:hypothetical protein DFQ00_111166 [Paenibacillus barcinonensis]|uniref:Uncharacterized protein n=1 Tax=Paenibacillus barcinonensis TaxID=198119 RepID=A0A2V4W9N8_PAEBA|nr:hypothetical protein DFQ00_111166 [Paenibacillus barcinonensis]
MPFHVLYLQLFVFLILSIILTYTSEFKYRACIITPELVYYVLIKYVVYAKETVPLCRWLLALPPVAERFLFSHENLALQTKRLRNLIHHTIKYLPVYILISAYCVPCNLYDPLDQLPPSCGYNVAAPLYALPAHPFGWMCRSGKIAF